MLLLNLEGLVLELACSSLQGCFLPCCKSVGVGDVTTVLQLLPGVLFKLRLNTMTTTSVAVCIVGAIAMLQLLPGVLF
jgi:hypothetical protein